MYKTLQIALILSIATASIVGCSTSTPQASPEAEKSFKGAPMPPDAQKQFAEQQKKSADLVAKKAAEGGGGQHVDPK